MSTIYNKVTVNNETIIDLSQDTVSSAAHIRSGYVGHLNDGTQVTGSFSGGSGYTTINIVPQQTVSTTTSLMNDSYYGFIQNGTPVDASKQYLITYDGTVYLCEGYVPEANATGVGDVRVTQTNATVFLETPFFIEYGSDNNYYFVTRSNTSHTIKVDEIVLSGGATSLQAKTNISPTTSSQTITADNGYDGLSSVQINAMPTMTLPTSAASSATSGYTSKATIGRSTSNQYINIPTGYNSAGAYYTISAVANGTATAPASISGTSATVSTGTNTLTLTKTVSVTPTISTAGYISSGTAGNSSVSLTASVTTKAATTYDVSSSDQTIASGTYLTGTQTIRGVTVSGLSAANIASGVTVKIGDAADDDRITSVTGSLAFSTIYTGSSAPSGSTGTNGDIYIQS